MVYTFTGNLRGREELIFRQSVLGSVGHIVLNVGEWEAALVHPSLRPTFRVDTLCGKNLKYNVKYSAMDGRKGVVRNACEYCFSEYDPEDMVKARIDYQNERKRIDDGLPF